MTTTCLLSNPSRKVTAALKKVLPGKFTFALEYSNDNEILKVNALTSTPVDQQAIHALVKLAAEWKIKLHITPHGNGQRILFS